MSSSCETCSKNADGGCSAEERQACTKSMAMEASNVKKVIAVMSGKGGVGKSTVTALLAAGLTRSGFKTGILDADVTGPSIPRMFGISKKSLELTEFGMLPALSRTGVSIVSMNLLLEKESDPIIWRGPLVAGAVKQFWEEVVWGDLDFLLVDLPPGTGDVPLTVMQSLPVSGIVIVSSPQELVKMIVKKAIKMAGIVKIPVLGLVENLSYAVCPKCGEEFAIFGETGGKKTAAETGIPFLGRLPLDQRLTEDADQGRVEQYEAESVNSFISSFLQQIKS
ncbi:MAG: Mrp/NBP35 family ATP-binding protein [Syntrophomonadaceae bacterium]|nr:Mrp/NBP35 family ATP-binding protein [Syntrophomonadaceae bacterium]